MNKDCCFILSILDEPLEQSRYLFDFDSYLSNLGNKTKFRVRNLNSKLQIWKHFLKNKERCSLYYHFFPVNECVSRYIDYIRESCLSTHANDFDVNYYLEENPDVKLEFKKSKNSLFPWNHFLNNGMFELRKFSFSTNISSSPEERRCLIQNNLVCPKRFGKNNSIIRSLRQKKIATIKQESESKETSSTIDKETLSTIDKEMSNCMSHETSKSTASTTDSQEDNQIISCVDQNCCMSQEEIKQLISSLLESKLSCFEETMLIKFEQQVADLCVSEEKINQVLPCMIEKILNNAPKVEIEQNNLMILSQIESTVDLKLQCMFRNKVKIQNGICFFKLPGLNLNSLAGSYHCYLDRLSLSVNKELNIKIDQVRDFFTICFVSGEQFKPVYASVFGTIKLITDGGELHIGSVYSRDEQLVYQLDSTLVNFNQNARILINLEFRLNLL